MAPFRALNSWVPSPVTSHCVLSGHKEGTGCSPKSMRNDWAPTSGTIEVSEARLSSSPSGSLDLLSYTSALPGSIASRAAAVCPQCSWPL